MIMILVILDNARNDDAFGDRGGGDDDDDFAVVDVSDDDDGYS